TRALRKTTPVIDVRNRHIMDATGDSVRFTDAHHRDVDDLGNFARKDLRKMTDIAGIITMRKKWHSSSVAEVFQIAPNQLPNEGRRHNCFRIVPVARRDCFELITVKLLPVTGLIDSTERPVPNDYSVAGMSRCYETIHDRIDHIMMRGEKFTPCPGDFYSNPVIRGDERRPRFCHIRLSGYSENKPIHHLAHDARVRLIIFNCSRIVP